MLVSHVAQAHAPDYALLVVAADAPLGQMTRLHLKLALALRLPVAVVLTRCECAAWRLEPPWEPEAATASKL